MTTTCIRGADWVVAWDPSASRHRYLRGADVVFRDERIVHVGPDFAGHFDVKIDAAKRLVLPGFIDLHAHPSLEPSYKGVREEHGVPEQFMTGLYERSQAFQPDDEGQRAGAEVAFGELLLSGVTTLVDISSPWPGWIELLAQSGLRGYVAPWYEDARWRMSRRHGLDFDWDEAAGKRAFGAARALMDEADAHPCARLLGLYSPGTIDCCTEATFRNTMEAASAEGRVVTTHASQSVLEFNEMVSRHGKTPIQWASDIGLLGPGTILGHAIFVDQHSWLHWHTERDVSLLADTHTTVAHCPTPFARYGQMLEDLGGYLRAGVNVGIGTDTLPHNFIEEMRRASMLSRIAARDINTLRLADVFDCATIRGAKALGRDDIGRLAVGAKADIVLVDTRHPSMRPLRDPLKSLVYSAAERAVREVFVDGRQVVAEGAVLGLDMADALGRLEEAQTRMCADAAGLDFLGRAHDEISPLTLTL